MHSAKSSAVRCPVTLTCRQGRCASRKTKRLAVPFAPVFIVVSLALARCRRHRQSCLADELRWALVEADDWTCRVRRLGVEVEHFLHSGDVLAIDRRHAPHLFLPRFDVLFVQSLPDSLV